MEVKVLGIMSPFQENEHNGISCLVNNNILLDAGSGSHKLNKFPDILDDLHIFITHLHWDHMNDLFSYLYASIVYYNKGILKNKINIYLPSYPRDKYKVITNEKDCYAEFHEINEKKIYKIDDSIITFSKMKHPIPSYAIKIENDKNSICYSGDLSFESKDKLARFAKDADLLMIESTLLSYHPKSNGHLTAYQAGLIGKLANAKETMLIHFSPSINLEEYRKEAMLLSNVTLAEEGMVKKIGGRL